MLIQSRKKGDMSPKQNVNPIIEGKTTFAFLNVNLISEGKTTCRRFRMLIQSPKERRYVTILESNTIAEGKTTHRRLRMLIQSQKEIHVAVLEY